MKKVWIEPGCIACHQCEFTAPEIFEVTDKSRVIKQDELEKYKELIEKAASKCPVSVIKFE